MRWIVRSLLGALTLPAAVVAAEVEVGPCRVHGLSATSEPAVRQVLAQVPTDAAPGVCLELLTPLEQALRASGAFAARVFVDPSPAGSRLSLRVIEGTLARDGVSLSRSASQVDDAVLRDLLTTTLQPGGPLRADRYERAILLVNDTPGLAGSSSQLYPAEQVGEARFELTPVDGPAREGEAYLDTFGSRHTGRTRLGATATLNSPWRRGDRFVVAANISSLGSTYLYADAGLPVGNHGTRLGLTLDGLDYRTDEASGLRGRARHVQVSVSHPVIRSRAVNLHVEAQLARDQHVDLTDTTALADRQIGTLALVVRGDASDPAWGGGVNAWRLQAVTGRLNLDGFEPYRDLDAATMQAAGRFTRWQWQVSRTQVLAPRNQLFVELAGQWASKNLDASQSLAFGGPQDFAGYHAGEVVGRSGVRARVQIRHDLGALLGSGRQQLSASLDVGRLRTQAQRVEGGFVVPGLLERRLSMQSLSLAATHRADRWEVQGLLGWPLRNRVPVELLGGEAPGLQAWVQASYRF